MVLSHNSRRIAVGLALWHLLLGAAGYSLHVVLDERGRSCAEAGSFCCCHHDGLFPHPVSAESTVGPVSLLNPTDDRHDPQACLLCRWLSQPRVSVGFTVPDAAGSPLVWLPGITTLRPVSSSPRPYAARGPPRCQLPLSV
jgi:hypothetical protein